MHDFPLAIRFIAIFGLPVGTLLLKAGFDDELWLMIIISLALIGLYAYVSYKDYQATKLEGTQRRFLIKCGVSVGLCLAYLIFCYDMEPLILFFLAFFGPLIVEWLYIKAIEKDENYRCPKCDLRRGLKLYRSDVIGQEPLNDGVNTGMRTYYQQYYRCKSCGYEFSERAYEDHWDRQDDGQSYGSYGGDSQPTDSNSGSSSTASSPSPARSMDLYTVNFRYRSGSAIKDECILMKSDHQPSIAEIREEIRSRKYYPDDVDIYCLRFGGGLPSATASHPDNLL